MSFFLLASVVFFFCVSIFSLVSRCDRHNPGRIILCCVIGCILCASLPPLLPINVAAAPSHREELRAIGLLIWQPNTKGEGKEKAAPHLFPIAVVDDGKFYDATLYRVTSRPLALETDTVYEGQHSGTPVGLFTIRSARNSGVWYGEGAWKLVPSGATASSAASRPIYLPERGEDEGDQRPRLKRTPQATTQVSGNISPPPVMPAPEDDPDRPTLRRGKAVSKVDRDIKAEKFTMPSAPGDVMVAVSDPRRPEPQSYAATLKTGAEARLKGALSGMAAREVARYLVKKNGDQAVTNEGSMRSPQRPSRRRSNQNNGGGPSLPWQDIQFRAFDLAGTNDTEVIFTARLPKFAPSNERRLDVFVSLISRLDLDGNPNLLFSQVTDTDHLDIFPRLELVDAVDAEGTRNGDLLFRAFDFAGMHYAIYKVGRGQVTKLFEGAPTAR